MRPQTYIDPENIVVHRTAKDGITAALTLIHEAIYYPPDDLMPVLWRVGAVLEHTAPGGDIRHEH